MALCREVSTYDGKICSLSQSEWLGVDLVFTVCYNEAYAREWPYQALPVCSHKHPSLVPTCAMGKYAAWLNLNSWIFTVVVMLPALAHCLLKALSGFAMHTQAWCPDNVHAQWENMQPGST